MYYIFVYCHIMLICHIIGMCHKYVLFKINVVKVNIVLTTVENVRRNTMKRLLALLLALTMLLGACSSAPAEGGDATGGGDATTTEPSDDGGDDASGEPREITIARQDTGVDNVSFNDGLAIYEEMEARLNLEITWEVLPGDQYTTNAQTRLASGQNLADIMQLPGSITDAVKYADQGMIIKLNELIDADEDMTNFLNEYPEIRSGITTPDGNIYFIANYLLDAPNGRGMLIRQDWLDQLGLDMPVTTDDWYNTLIAFRDNSQELTGTDNIVPFGGTLGGVMPGNPRFFYTGFGLTAQQSDEIYYYIDDSGNIVYDAMRDEFKDYLEFANMLFTEGLMDPMFGAGQSQINDLVNQNLVASIVNNPGDADNYNNSVVAAGAESAAYTFAFPPVDAEGDINWASLPTVRGTHFMGITKDAEDPTLAMEVLSYLWASEEGTMLNMFGIEGEHWNYVDGVPTFTDEMLNDPQYNIILMLRRIGSFLFMDIQTRDFNIARGVGEYKKGLNLILENEDSLATTLPVFIPTADESEQIQDVWPDVKSYIDEMTLKFIMGDEPIENFDSFRDTLEGMGINDLTAVYQGMYDRYLAG